LDDIELWVLHLAQLHRGIVPCSCRAIWHDLYEEELRLRVGVGERIVIGASTAARPNTDLVGDGDRRRSLQGGKGIASGGVCRVVGGGSTLADDVEIFSRGVEKKTMHHDPGFGGIRCARSSTFCFPKRPLAA
jgi:hypothetical protein